MNLALKPILLVCALVLSLAVGLPSFAEDGPNLYQALGLKKNASQEEILTAFEKIRLDTKRSAEQLIEARAAYFVLSQGELKRDYDSGKSMELPMRFLREEFRRERKEPELKAPREESWLVQQASGLSSFYLAAALTEFSHCFRVSDPITCETFVQSLVDPLGMAGMGLFIAGAEVAGRLGRPHLGLGMGIVLSEIPIELYYHEASFAYREAKKLYDQDPGNPEKKKKMDEAWNSIWAGTTKDWTWWGKHSVSLLTAYASSIAAGHTVSLAQQKLAQGAQSKRGTDGSNSTLAKNCILNGMSRTLHFSTAHPSLTTGTLNLVLFMVINHWLRGKIDQMSSWSSVDFKLAGKRLETPSNKAKDSHLTSTTELWNRYREALISKAAPLMSTYRTDFNKLETELRRSYLHYQWIMNGMKDDDLFKTLRMVYHKPDSTPQSLVSEANKYAKAFFCGPQPEQAFRDSSDVHGIPVPLRFSPKATAFSVVRETPETCAKTPAAEFRKRLNGNEELREHARRANAEFLFHAQSANDRRIALYENQISDFLKDVLTNEKRSTTTGLPLGLLPSVDVELKDLAALERQKLSPELANQVKTRKEALEQQKQVFADMLDDLNTPPELRDDKREARNERRMRDASSGVPGVNADTSLVDQLLELGEDLNAPDSPPPSDAEKQRWEKALRYFKSFVIDQPL